MAEPLDLTRSTVLALWLATGDTGPAAVRAVQADDEPHGVTDAGDDPLGSTAALSDALAGWSAPDLDVVALLPAPGDVVGVPADVSADALAAGEVVLLRTGSRFLAAVPEVTSFGSDLEPGHLVTWRVHEVPDWRVGVQSLGSLEDADRALRQGLVQVTDALVRLDVAHWDDEHAARVIALRDAALPTWRLPDRLDGRRARVLASAARLLAIVDVATLDHGGALTVWQADQRTAALHDVDRLARRALAAATLAGPVRGPLDGPRDQPSTRR
ncbi:hypothetical protein KIN34_13425 [Cellulomonas sp. DKR-3]|uniref:Uncharacterized protein n=1 Tax=Cellulomonas fulva TaxID=2835530 RepID=A0ABS5U1N5_9CELL|nr:hypothetical protein [Cellulomonas fulva]MBT0995285.1 hypothetical protein [Cellulomonas fulva]